MSDQTEPMRDRTTWLQAASLRCTKWFRGLFSDTCGQEMVEYAVFIGLVALVAALALPPLVERVTSVLMYVNQAMPVGKPTNCGNLNPELTEVAVHAHLTRRPADPPTRIWKSRRRTIQHRFGFRDRVGAERKGH